MAHGLRKPKKVVIPPIKRSPIELAEGTKELIAEIEARRKERDGK